MFEDLVFTITEKTAPDFFPEILIPPRAVSSQGPNHWGDAGSGDGGNDGERRDGCCAVFRPYPVLGGPSPGNGGGIGTPPAADQGLGEQSSDFSGLSPLVAPRAFISTEATTVTTVAERINIFAKYQLSSS